MSNRDTTPMRRERMARGIAIAAMNGARKAAAATDVHRKTIAIWIKAAETDAELHAMAREHMETMRSEWQASAVAVLRKALEKTEELLDGDVDIRDCLDVIRTVGELHVQREALCGGIPGDRQGSAPAPNAESATGRSTFH